MFTTFIDMYTFTLVYNALRYKWKHSYMPVSERLTQPVHAVCLNMCIFIFPPDLSHWHSDVSSASRLPPGGSRRLPPCQCRHVHWQAVSRLLVAVGKSHVHNTLRPKEALSSVHYYQTVPYIAAFVDVLQMFRIPKTIWYSLPIFSSHRERCRSRHHTTAKVEATRYQCQQRARPCIRSLVRIPRSVVKCTGWRTEKCGARSVNGRRRAHDMSISCWQLLVTEWSHIYCLNCRLLGYIWTVQTSAQESFKRQCRSLEVARLLVSWEITGMVSWSAMDVLLNQDQLIILVLDEPTCMC